MSQNAQRDMSGVLFTNDRKEKDTHPDFNGSATIDGKEFWVSAWTKSGQKGDFYSLAFKVKEAKGPKPVAPKLKTMSQDLDDEIPF